MRFTSTRDKNLDSGFLNAILDALPSDGGLYVPEGNANLRRWILYMDERTPFPSIAGALTSACINDEFSPIICETIVTHAFPFEPKVKQLDENLFTMELFNGPTGCHRDFGISYLVSCLETISILQDRKPILLDITTGKHGAILSHVMREKKNIKSVLVYPKGQLRGLSEKDFIWNGGNIFPVEADGDEELCRKLVREILSERSLVEKYTLTISTTANIGRLLPHSFFYTYAFSRLKKKVSGDIYYALAPGNYSNLVAGLYSWRLSLPMSGLIVPASGALNVDIQGYPVISDSLVPKEKREPIDPSVPSNLERLEDFFTGYSSMIKSFIYPARISDAEAENAAKELYKKYSLVTDRATSRAFAAAKKTGNLETGSGDAVVLIQRDHPAYSAEFAQHTLGETVSIPQNILDVQAPFKLNRSPIKTRKELIKILDEVSASA